ncbi:hypothetical protein GCM10010233_05120 [Streptomyces pseudogriseolus]|nr:hypothetical protein GCM10010233_05120 [Streptomyces gancidicus]
MSRPTSPGDHSTRAGVGLADGFAGGDGVSGGDGFSGASGVRLGDAGGPGASGVRDGTSIRTGGAPCPSAPAGCTVHPAAPTAIAPSAARTAMPCLLLPRPVPLRPVPLPLMPLPRTPAPRRPAVPVLPGRHLSSTDFYGVPLSSTPDVTGAEPAGIVGCDRMRRPPGPAL